LEDSQVVPASPSGKGFVDLFIFKDVGAAVVGEMSDFWRAIYYGEKF
jgi:hypothetical protein